MSDTRWVTREQLSLEVGYSVRQIDRIYADEPSVLIRRTRNGVPEYRQPDAARALRKREADKARRAHAPAVSLDEARTRKALAEAELAEIELAKARQEIVTLTDYEEALGRILDRLMARLRSLPVRLAHYGPDAEAALEKEVERVVEELAAWDDDVVEAPTEASQEVASVDATEQDEA